MTATSNTNGPSRDDTLTRELLLLADREEIQPPPDVFDRVRARLHENTVRSPSAASAQAKAPWTKRPWFASVGAAAFVLIALLFYLQPSNIAWSQVAKTVRAMPWIHVEAVSGRGQSSETWTSFCRNIGAMRTADMFRYDDFRSGIRYEYDLQKKKLYLFSASRGEESFMAWEGTFQAIFRGDATLAENFLEQPIVKQQQRTVSEQGRRWILYELELDGPYNRDAGETTTAVIRVDPEKMLPDLMTLTHGNEKVQLTIDYPNEGPADVYALGVPPDAPVDDRMPPPDLSRILKLVEQNRRDFGNYLAIAGGNNQDSRSIVHLIRRKGGKWRVDVGIGDTQHVASAADMEQWWRAHGRETLPEGRVLCDGRRVYQHSLVNPDAGWKPVANVRHHNKRADAGMGIHDAYSYLIELLTYPPNLDLQNLSFSPLYTVHLDPNGENGPAGSVRVERRMAKSGRVADRRTYHKEEFWLQPKYGYAVVKHVWSDCPEVDEDPLRKEKRLIVEHDGFRQTPRGVWYPTVVRRKNAIQLEHKNEPRGSESHDQLIYFYLNFDTELPDKLFSPQWQGDLLAGIDFAQPDDKPKSNDLGKIRPPGGAPLRVVGPEGEFIVDGLHRVRKRLEAVPKADLERWVAELERIIDKKLKDGLPSARQACRTDFVTRMSLAFDGLKWNSKSAENLFQRAQTLPASEAKVWVEAFELLLDKEIGQTDKSNYDGGPAWAVPLVLIPVDALHDGQKYNADRARKYLARMRQLTIEDVALWRDKVDEFGGTNLDAAMNIILLDDYFDQEKFQRNKFKAAIEARGE